MSKKLTGWEPCPLRQDGRHIFTQQARKYSKKKYETCACGRHRRLP